MSPNLSLIHDEKKFMWDGCFYATQEAASAVTQAYQANDFEVHILEEEEKFLVYTRRVVKESVA